MRVRRFRVSGVRPNFATAYVTGTLVDADAPEHVQDAFKDQVRDRFADQYPDAIYIREREWTEKVT